MSCYTLFCSYTGLAIGPKHKLNAKAAVGENISSGHLHHPVHTVHVGQTHSPAQTTVS